MTKENARSKICPFMSTGFAADTDRLRNEGVINVPCDPDKCMFWKATKTEKESETTECHRCYQTVSLGRNTCSHCNAFIRGFGADIPMDELHNDMCEGECSMIPGGSNE